MDVALAQKIIDDKPSSAVPFYIDGDDQIRDKNIEQLFNDLYSGKPLDDIFKHNFAGYHRLATKRKGKIPNAIWTDFGAAGDWITDVYGLLHVYPLGPHETAAYARSAPVTAAPTHAAHLRSQYGREAVLAHAPGPVHAALLAVVLIFRDMADRRIAVLFEDAIAG